MFRRGRHGRREFLYAEPHGSHRQIDSRGKRRLSREIGVGDDERNTRQRRNPEAFVKPDFRSNVGTAIVQNYGAILGRAEAYASAEDNPGSAQILFPRGPLILLGRIKEPRFIGKQRNDDHTGASRRTPHTERNRRRASSSFPDLDKGLAKSELMGPVGLEGPIGD